MRLKSTRRGERGAALVEFSIAALVFLTSVFAVIEFGRLLWTHNALTDAARRGARYAVNHLPTEGDKAAGMAVYATTDDGANSPVVTGLQKSNVNVVYSPDFNVGQGTVSVSIQNYDFDFVVPLIGRKIRMPDYTSTLTGESAGTLP
ncbi:MAG TPA: TadE/TadG family type IV pilus assembly protein [Pyrinomonadaceae bacterium]